jgi:hypothetical protein
MSLYQYEVGDLIHYRKGNGLDPNRYMLVLEHTTKNTSIFTQRAYKLLEVRRGDVLEWEQDWVEGEMIPA